MNIKKDKNKIIGLAATVIFHVVALVLLFTLCFRTPLPLPGEAGVEVNLGMYAEAMNQIAEEQTSQTAEESVTQPEEVEEEEDIEEEIMSEDEDVPSIEEHKVEEEITEEAVEEIVEEVIEEKPVINQRAMFQVRKNDNTQPSEGNKDGIGEQGNPNGLKDLDRYEGNGGSGDGPAFDLGGRGAKSISSPSKDFKEEGKVVVDIWVDKEGKVQRAEIGKGTTVSDSYMLESAKKAAFNSIFNKDDKAADLQRGTITYTFIMRQ